MRYANEMTQWFLRAALFAFTGLACGQTGDLDPCDISPVQACFCDDGSPGARSCSGGACDCAAVADDPCPDLPIRYVRLSSVVGLFGGSSRVAGVSVQSLGEGERFVRDPRFRPALQEFEQTECAPDEGVLLSRSSGSASEVFELPVETVLGDSVVVYGCRRPPSQFDDPQNPSTGLSNFNNRHVVEVSAYPGGPWKTLGTGRGLGEFPVTEGVVPRLCEGQAPESIEDLVPDDVFSNPIEQRSLGDACRPFSFVRVQARRDGPALLGASYFDPDRARFQPQVADYAPSSGADARRNPEFARAPAVRPDAEPGCNERNAVSLGDRGTVILSFDVPFEEEGLIQLSSVPGCDGPSSSVPDFSVWVAQDFRGPYRFIGSVGRVEGTLGAIRLEDLDDGCISLSTPALEGPAVDLDLTGSRLVGSEHRISALTSNVDSVEWTLQERPDGSSTSLVPSSNGSRLRTFTPDRPGRYQIRVIVRDAEGRTNAALEVVDVSDLDCDDVVVVDSAITTPTTWSPQANRACPAYRVRGVQTVFASLTIEPGTRVEFERRAGLWVLGQGRLQALGSFNRPVVLESDDGQSNHWEALSFESNEDNRLEYVLMSGAGAGADLGSTRRASAGVVVRPGGRVSIEGSVVDDVGTWGLLVAPGGTLGTFTGNSFGGEEASVLLPADQVQKLDPSGFYRSDRVVVSGGDPVPSVWPALSVPIRLSDLFFLSFTDQQGVLEISPGAILEFDRYAGLVALNGGLNIRGTADAPITLRGVNPTERGYWEGVVFDSLHPDNRIEHAVIRNAGSARDFASGRLPAQVVVRGAVALNDVTFSRGISHGVHTLPSADLRSFERNRFEDHGDSLVRLYAHQLEAISPSNVFDGGANSFPEVVAFASVLNRSHTWSALDVPVVFQGVTWLVRSNEDLVVEPGAHFKFERNAGLGISAGRLRAIGTMTDPITFEGVSASPGFWEAIVVNSPELGSEIAFADIRHAGSGTDLGLTGRTPAAVMTRGVGALLVRDSTIGDSQQCTSGLGVELERVITENCQ